MATQVATGQGIVRVPTGIWTVVGAMRDADGHDPAGLKVRETFSRTEIGHRWQHLLEERGVAVPGEVGISADISAICTTEEG